jgi:hypothetical protein
MKDEIRARRSTNDEIRPPCPWTSDFGYQGPEPNMDFGIQGMQPNMPIRRLGLPPKARKSRVKASSRTWAAAAVLAAAPGCRPFR